MSATCPVHELSSLRVDQSARCPVCELSSPRVGISASCSHPSEAGYKLQRIITGPANKYRTDQAGPKCCRSGQYWLSARSGGLVDKQYSRLVRCMPKRSVTDKPARKWLRHCGMQVQYPSILHWLRCFILYCSVSQKKGATVSMAITLSILHRFAKFFHCCKEQ